MPKYKFKLTETFRMPLKIEFEVEFDTETGETDVVSDGRVVMSPDGIRRREINRQVDIDTIDEKAFAKLIEDGVIERPNPGDTIVLHGEKYVVDIDDPEDITDPDDRPLSPDEIIESLTPLADYTEFRRLRLARRRRP